MKNILDLTSQQLRRAAEIKEQIASLENQMQNLLGQQAVSAPQAKGGMSPAARAKISAAAKARWAKVRAAKGKQTTVTHVQKTTARKPMSAAQKAKIGKTMKARWAKINAAKKS